MVGCSRDVEFQEILPESLPVSAKNIQSSVYQVSGYSQWTVYLKFDCDESEFREYVKEIGLEECEPYMVPLGLGSPTSPSFWDPQVSVHNERKDEIGFNLSKGAEIISDDFVYSTFGALWLRGYAYVYFFSQKRTSPANSRE